MDRIEIEARVKKVVAEQFGVDLAVLTEDTSFVNDLNADSLDSVEVIMEIEDEFEIVVPDGEMDDIHTIREAIDYVENQNQ
tara:strand:- start:8482 stop:8724 length:243 start_codon:yes stop_codon:yes gene_type:complete